ncbi:MAG: histidine ammonia-lyase [Flavobacteriales bacterium]
MKNIFQYGHDFLTPGTVLKIATGEITGILTDSIKEKVQNCRQTVENIAYSNKVVYGINTGFGVLANKRISPEDGKTLQYKILQSHSSGLGKPIAEDIAKIMLITKVHALAKGFSGCQLETLERLIWHIENDVIPVIPEKGSVGASGDLAPLSHMSLPLIGLGDVFYQGKKFSTQEILNQFGLKPISLEYKEGLALINGTQFMLAHAVKAIERLQNALDTADIIGAMSIEALMGSQSPFQPHFHLLRPYKGNQLTAQRIRKILENSEIGTSHIDCDRVQDPYSVRCIPQVHGASRNAWLHLKETIEIELNAVTDNPVIFSETDTISGGHFHGQPIALPMDYACFAAAELGNISDRRTYLLIEGKWDLPVLLMDNIGLNSGFMIPQYATAALVTENKTLSFPSSADSVPTSLGQEDHVSMGSISGRKLNTVIANLEQILSVELLNAAQALDFRRPLKSSVIIEEMHALVRSEVDFATEDRIFAIDIEKIHTLIHSKKFINHFNQKTIELGLNINENFEEFSI